MADVCGECVYAGDRWADGEKIEGKLMCRLFKANLNTGEKITETTTNQIGRKVTAESTCEYFKQKAS